MNRSFFALTATVFLGLLAGTATELNATPIIASSTGLSNPVYTITFDEHVLAMNSSVTTQYSDFGVTFSPNLYYSPQTGFGHVQGNDLGNFQSFSSAFINPFSISFNNAVTGAAFAFDADGTPYTFTALLNNVPVESFTTTVGVSNNDFFGFTGIDFNQISVTTAGAGGGPYNVLDNIQIGPAAVPEPSTFALFGAVIGLGVGGLVWRRRRTVEPISA
jgi:hypothetical protein